MRVAVGHDPAVAAPTELVLVGAGHAHVQVLRRWMMAPLPGVRLTLVVDRPEAVYSGMVPGFVCRDYGAAELEIDAVPLARRAGARVVLSEALGIDPEARRIELADRPPLPYDLASLDVGSTVAGLDLPGVREHALATRPIRRFVDRLDGAVARARAARGGQPLRVGLVGAGAAGTELAFTLGHRLAADGVEAELTLVAASPEVLPGSPPRVASRARRIAEARGVRVRTGLSVEAVEKEALLLRGPAGREALPCDLVLWATGAAPPALVAASPLPREERGFVRVDAALRVVGHEGLFAVGDCAVQDDHPWVPRAGVHAVRQGPALDHNLRAWLRGRRLRPHRPQRDFLMLLNLGGGRAFGAKWGLAAEGRLVWRVKDAIDRRFMGRFRVLEEDGAPAPGFPAPMEMAPMACGGCAAKVGARPLEAALARLAPAPPDPGVRAGLEAPDDAAVWSAGEGEAGAGEVTLATVDAFRAFTDDPFLVGRVAAVNAVSDVAAKGGQARHALALVTLPELPPEAEAEALYQVLSGVRAALDPLGVSLVGGHTTRGPELFVGLAVTGRAPEGAWLPLAGARPGDALILTKPLGTGCLLAADMQGRARGAWLAAAFASMLRPNAAAARVAREGGTRAATDVSGFGLAGHLTGMLAASGASARISLAGLPLLPGAEPLLAAGLRSTFHGQNQRDARAVRAAGPALERSARFAALFDPQTSGGLLLAVPGERADGLCAALHEAGEDAATCIGHVQPARADGVRLEAAP